MTSSLPGRLLVGSAAVAVIVFGAMRSPEAALGPLVLFGAIWWLRRNQPKERRHRVRPNRVRREVLRVALCVVGIWVTLSLVKAMSELGDGAAVGAAGSAGPHAAADPEWPFSFLVTGLVSTLAVSYGVLAVGLSPLRRKRKRRGRDKEAGLPIVSTSEPAQRA